MKVDGLDKEETSAHSHRRLQSKTPPAGELFAGLRPA